MSQLLSAPKPSTEPVTLPVRCRPNTDNWAAIVLASFLFGVLLCMFALGSPSGFSAGLAAFWGPLAIYTVPVSFYGAWLTRATIIADEQGLRWRGLGRWYSLAWEDLTDYYTQFKPGTSAIVSVIEGRNCCFRLTDEHWGAVGCRRIRDVVTVYAIQARPTQWQMRGTRPELDWPRAFRYDTRQNRGIVHQVSFFLTLITVLLFFPWHLSYSTVWWKAVSLTSVLGSVAWLAFKMCVIWKVKQAAHRRFDEQIIITLDGISWEKGEGSVTFAWGNITDYYMIAERRTGWVHRIIAPQGKIDFTLSIEASGILQQVITQQAVGVTAKKWRIVKVSDALGGVAAKWSSGREGIGDRIYHYRTRSNNLRMWILTAVLLPFMLLFMAAWLMSTLTITDPTPGVIIVAVFGLPLFWGWYRYRAASVRTNGNGITQYIPFGKKHIAWDDIVHCDISGDPNQRNDASCAFGNVIGSNTHIRFWMEIADVEELKDEITRRAVHANGDWQGITDDTYLGTSARDGSNLAGKSGSTRAESDYISAGSRHGR